MPPALLTLLRLQFHGAVRRALGNVKTPRGAVFAVIGLLVIVMWLLPAALPVRAAPPVEPQRVREWGPVALLAVTVWSAVAGGDRAIAFTGGEVNFLFAGPFTRRQLLVYKLAKSLLGSAALALLLSLSYRRFASYWPAAFVGLLLAFLFVNLCTVGVGILTQSLGERFDTGRRRAGLLLTMAIVVTLAASRIHPGADWKQTVLRLRDSPAGRVILAPAVPFVRAFTAPSLGTELLTWTLAAAAVDAAVLALLLRLDADYLEASAAASERQYQRVQRARRGERLPDLTRQALRPRIAPFPWLGGAGPVAWRQSVTLLRKSGTILLMGGVCAVILIVFVFGARAGVDLRGVVAPAAVWVTVMVIATLRFDFRGDLDHMAALKALPLRPLAVVAGQLAAPTAAVLLCHLVLFAAAVAFFPHLRRPAALAALVVPPLDLLAVTVENGVFLLFPHRPPATPGELGSMGRQVVLFLLRVVAIAVAVGVAAGFAGVVFVLARSPVLSFAVAGIVLTAEALALLPLVAIAYDKFDPSLHAPAE